MTSENTPMNRAPAVAVLFAAAMLLTPGGLGQLNPVPDIVQSTMCGNETTNELVEETDWPTGECGSSTEYEHPALSRPECEGCDEHSFLDILDQTLVSSHQTPPLPLEDIGGTGLDEGTLDQPVGTLEGVREDDHPAGPRYCLYFTEDGGERQLLQCFDPTGAVYPLVPEFERELVREPAEDIPLTPPVEEGDVLGSQQTPRMSYDLQVGYRWNETRLHMQVGPGLVEYWAPIDFGDAGAVQWWMDNGHGTSYDVIFVLYVEGEDPVGVGIHVPLVGQVLAAQANNTP